VAVATDISVVPESDYEALNEFVLSLRDGPEAALNRLQGKTDADSLRRRAKLLMDLERPEQAVELLAPLPRDHRWIEQFLRATIRAGNFDLASDLVTAECAAEQWPRGARSAVIGFHELQEYMERSYGQLDEITISRAPSGVAQFAKALESCLSLLVSSIHTRGSIATTLDRVVCLSQLSLRALSGSLRAETQLISLLERARPFPIELANLALARQITPRPEWLARLRLDHADSLDALIMAQVLDAHHFDNAKTAFAEVIALAPKATDDYHRRQVFSALHEISNGLGPDEVEVTTRAAESLLVGAPDLRAYFQAELALKKNDLDTATRLLDEWRNDTDPMWVQLMGHLERARGRPQESIRILKSYVERNAHRGVLHQLADIAFRARDFATARDALQKVVAGAPDDVGSRFNLGLAYVNLADHKNALPHLEAVHERLPADTTFALTLAKCHADIGQIDLAIGVLREHIRLSPRAITPKLYLSSLLQAQNRPVEAFDLLRPEFETHSKDPTFLGAYLGAAHRANQDAEGHRALTRMLELRDAGTIPDDVLRPAPMEELVAHFEKHRARVDAASADALKGRMPWIAIAEVENSPPYWAWFVRTQPLLWHGERPLNVSALSIYSTNGFTVVKTDQGSNLVKVRAPAPGGPVTVDITALITINELGLFQQLGTYFSKVYVPANYLERAVIDRHRLLPHQLSQRESLEVIRTAHSSSQVRVRSKTDTRQCTRLSDQVDESSFRLVDVLAALRSSGLLSRELDVSLASVAHPPQRESRMALNTPLQVDLTTLRTLASINMLATMASHWSVYVTEEDWDDLQSTLAAFDKQERVYKAHESLWKSVMDAPFVETVPAIVPADERTADAGDSAGDGDDDDDSPSVARLFDSGRVVSRITGSPLMVDDRFYQQLVLTFAQSSPSTAFGTDAWLTALLSFAPAQPVDIAPKYLSLMQRRYKFLVPSTDMLEAILKAYPFTVPNAGLSVVSRYVHMCFRDPGLYTGIEQTTNPTSIAIRLYLTWVRRLAEMLARVWRQDEFPEDYARALTTWVVSDCLPSVPLGLGPLANARVSWSTMDVLLLHFVMASFDGRANDEERMTRAFESLKDALGLPDSDYVSTITEVLERAATMNGDEQ